MENITMTFTVHEWRVIAASMTVGAKRLHYPHDQSVARDLSIKIAGQTGKYDSEGKRRE